MKPIESNNSSITLNSSGTNKRQKTDAGQLPQTPSDSIQYFNAYIEETTGLSSWFGAGQNSPLGKLANIAVASSQQSLPTTITSKNVVTQKAKVKDAITRHDDFFKAYPSKNYNLDMDLVKEAVSAFINHDSILDILLYACCYFFTRSDNQAIIPSSQVIENAGAIAKAFSKPVEYNEEDACTSLKMDSLKIKGVIVGKMNLYTMEEKVKNYQPLKHIFTFLKNGKINSLESLEGDILSHNDKEHNADEFNKLLIKVILNYGDFASPTNSVKLLSKLEELGCGKELLSELEKLGHNPDITLDLVAENPTNNFQPNSLSPVFMDVTTLQPNQVQDMSWEQIVVEFKKSGKLCNAQNQVLYTSDIRKDLLELIINCKGKFATMSYDEKQGMSNLISYYGEGVFIAYLIFLKNEQIDVKRGDISKKFKDYFALALEKLKEKIDVDHKIEFLKAVVTMIGELDLNKDTLKSIKKTYNKKNIIVDSYDFCDQIGKLNQSEYEFPDPQSVIDPEVIPVATSPSAPWNHKKEGFLGAFKYFRKEPDCIDSDRDEDLVVKLINVFEEHTSVIDMLGCACNCFFPRNNNQKIPPDQVIENAGAIAKVLPIPIEYNNKNNYIGLKIGKSILYYRDEPELFYQPLRYIFTFLQSGKMESLEEVVLAYERMKKKIKAHNIKKLNDVEFNKLLIKVILNYGDFASPINSVKLVSKLEELGCGKELLSELEKLGYNPDITLYLVPENPMNNFQPDDSLPPPVFKDVTTLQPNQVQDMSWAQIFERFKTHGELCNAQNQVLYTSDISKDLVELIIDCKGKFATMSYDKKQGMSSIIVYYGEGVFIAYLMFLKNEQIDVKQGEISKKFKDYFALALEKLKEKIDVNHKIKFLQAVVAMIGELDLDKDTLKFIKKTYNIKSNLLDINKYSYNFCAAVNDIVISKKKAKKAEESRRVDIIYDQKILYPQAIPKNLLELIINSNGRFSKICYYEKVGIRKLISFFGEGVFIAYLVALKHEQINGRKQKYFISKIKNYFELALSELEKGTDVNRRIEFLQAVVTMIGELLGLIDKHISSIVDIYNKKNITGIDEHSYDFCKEINKLTTQSKHEVSGAQSAIDSNVIPVDTQLNGFGAEDFLKLDLVQENPISTDLASLSGLRELDYSLNFTLYPVIEEPYE